MSEKKKKKRSSEVISEAAVTVLCRFASCPVDSWLLDTLVESAYCSWARAYAGAGCTFAGSNRGAGCT
jgi:hypothetical protein